MPRDRINAIVMTYNSMSTLDRCIMSLNGRADRILVVDGRYQGFPGKYNSSKDGTVEWILDYQSKADSEVLLYVYPDDIEPVYEYEKRSLSMALVPIGEWILFVDSDEEVTQWPGDPDFELHGICYKIWGISGKYGMYRRLPGLRFTENPHCRVVSDYGEVDFRNFPLLDVIDIVHQPEAKAPKEPEHVEYLNWLWRNPVRGDRLNYDEFLTKIGWIPIQGR